jgi:serine/threonine-protein kinase RIO1
MRRVAGEEASCYDAVRLNSKEDWFLERTSEILIPKECCAKVYKTTLNEFRTRSKYIKDDYRFKDRYKHLNPRKVVKLWAEKVD